MYLGILRERKYPTEKRTPLTPLQCKKIESCFPKIKIFVQKSKFRCFEDEEYAKESITLSDNLERCDLLLGVKEVPILELIPNKTYMFFSHTTKQQSYNRNLLSEILKKNIQLIDYEALNDNTGKRIIGFGKYAGLIGAYNSIRCYGIKKGIFHLLPAHKCDNFAHLCSQFSNIVLPPIKIIVTGSGNAGNGAKKMLDTIGINQIKKEDFLYKKFKKAAYVQLRSIDYHIRKDKKNFIKKDFYQNPELFESILYQFIPYTNVLISASYWNPKAPLLFTVQEMKKSSFNIQVIADITCDIKGSIPCTVRTSTIESPFYDFNPQTNSLEEAFSREKNITVMATDNLPGELPKESSRSFGQKWIDKVLPELLKNHESKIIQRATITNHGKLTRKYEYLADWIKGKKDAKPNPK